MEWVLIVIWITFNGDTDAMTADFNSKAACEAGLIVAAVNFDFRFGVKEMFARCVSKGAP